MHAKQSYYVVAQLPAGGVAQNLGRKPAPWFLFRYGVCGWLVGWLVGGWGWAWARLHTWCALANQCPRDQPDRLLACQAAATAAALSAKHFKLLQ